MIKAKLEVNKLHPTQTLFHLIDNRRRVKDVYRSFGYLRNKLGIDSPFLFSSKPLDTETNLYYYINRYYDPDTGRFITQDLLKLIDRPNPYIYPNNDPINFIDPYGLCGERRDRKEIPWWEKLEKGYYYGTGFGEEALEYYVQRWLETGNPLWAIPAGISALWTPKTYQNTASLLITAASLSGWAARTGAQYTIKAYRYSRSGGGGISLYREGRRIFGIDWHQWGKTPKNLITKFHIYIRKIGQHLPWKWFGLRK